MASSDEAADRAAGRAHHRTDDHHDQVRNRKAYLTLNRPDRLNAITAGMARRLTEGRWFQEFAAQHGFPAAVRWRDSSRPIPDGGGPVPTTAELDEE
jgi:enoyl-CoA hydratase